MDCIAQSRRAKPRPTKLKSMLNFNAAFFKTIVIRAPIASKLFYVRS